jgi:hypothetical protein
MPDFVARLNEFARREPVPLASLFVAACAFWLTLYQVRATDYQNRLSVVPQLEFVSEESADGKSIDIFLENNGLGPARITGIEAHVGNEFTRFATALDWRALRGRMQAAGIPMEQAQAASLPINGYVRSQQKLLLLRIPVSSDEQRANVESRLESLDINVCYCSLYGDCMDVAQRDGVSDEKSCRFDGATKIFGSYIRFRVPWSTRLDTSVTHGR